MYIINNKEYRLKEKYTLKDWGQILKILSDVDKNNIENSLIILLSGNKITELLNIILDRKIEDDIYEDDFEIINKVIADFFTRKSSLIKATNSSLVN